MRKRSEVLKSELKTIRYWERGLRRALNSLSDRCRKFETVDLPITDKAVSLSWEIEENLDKIYERQIGKAVVSEL